MKSQTIAIPLYDLFLICHLYRYLSFTLQKGVLFKFIVKIYANLINLTLLNLLLKIAPIRDLSFPGCCPGTTCSASGLICLCCALPPSGPATPSTPYYIHGSNFSSLVQNSHSLRNIGQFHCMYFRKRPGSPGRRDADVRGSFRSSKTGFRGLACLAQLSSVIQSSHV